MNIDSISALGVGSLPVGTPQASALQVNNDAHGSLAENNNYLSLHIFYNMIDLRPVVLGCVDPIVRRLEDKGLISRYFFVRYWEEGSHIRLRLLPMEAQAVPEIRRETETVITRFFDERPSFFDAEPEALGPVLRSMFEREYGGDEWKRLFGPEGSMPIAENNSFSYRRYHPEYDRYGGKEGMALAEQHFWISSVTALEAMRDSNSHVRPNLLGLAMQLMTHFALAALGDKDELRAFYKAYVQRWSQWVPATIMQRYDDRYGSRQYGRLATHFADVEAVHERFRSSGKGVLGRWLNHGYWLRENLERLYGQGLIELKPQAESAKEAIGRLMASYIHMMNNRLGILIPEEVYLAAMILQAFGEQK